MVAAVRGLRTAFDRYDEAVARQLGLTRSDLRALELLELGPVSAGEIARQLQFSSGSVTGLLDRLEEQGFVRREPAPDDRRKVVVVLQGEAYARVEAAYAPCADAIAAVGEGLDPAALEVAERAVRGAAAGIRDATAPLIEP